jgi:hypothetical protein
MKPDINYLSFNGPNRAPISYNNPNDLIPGSEFADTIKCSTGLRDFYGRFATVTSGYEDALDVNNGCVNIDIEAALWRFPTRPKMGFTVKGDSHNVTIRGSVEGDPLVDIGNASDQSHAWVTGTRLGLRRTDGKPIRVRVLAGEFPEELPGSGPYTYVFPWRIRWSPFRRFLVKCFLQYRRTFQK